MGLLASLREYRRFQKLDDDARALVFYAETGQDWHHFEPLVQRLTGELGRRVCYVTSDASDPAFAHAGERLRCFHVPEGWLRMLFFRTLRADVLVLTMLDLDNLELRRSVHPVHYVYVFHSLGSTHMVDGASAYDHYDTILCSGPHQIQEIRRREALAQLRAKRLLPHGSARLEALLREVGRSEHEAREDLPTVLIAPTWGQGSLLPLCGETLVATLLDAGHRVILRPHYQTLRSSPDVVRRILTRFRAHPRLEYVDRMGDSSSLRRADVMIGDWSHAGIEYALTYARPVLFIDVPPRVRNPRFTELGLEPLEMSIRPRIGAVLAPDRIGEAPALIEKLRSETARAEDLVALREKLVFNVGRSAQVGAEAIARIADERARERRSRT